MATKIIEGIVVRIVNCRHCYAERKFWGATMGEVFRHEEEAGWQSSERAVAKNTYDGTCNECSELPLGVE